MEKIRMFILFIFIGLNRYHIKQLDKRLIIASVKIANNSYLSFEIMENKIGI